MRSAWLQRDTSQHALVFFAGWGMDDRPFRRLTSTAFDICVCYDYRNFEPQRDAASLPLSDYDQVTIVAWSFGCAAAAQVMACVACRPQQALAINGTVTPESETMGIATNVLDGTAESLLNGGWDRFVRRMCLDKAARLDFGNHLPKRDLPGALTELADLRAIPTPQNCLFSRALVGTRDRIILPENQDRGWQRFAVPVHRITAPHYPFYLWDSWEDLLLSNSS